MLITKVTRFVSNGMGPLQTILISQLATRSSGRRKNSNEATLKDLRRQLSGKNEDSILSTSDKQLPDTAIDSYNDETVKDLYRKENIQATLEKLSGL
jgi:hypothetical protein